MRSSAMALFKKKPDTRWGCPRCGDLENDSQWTAVYRTDAGWCNVCDFYLKRFAEEQIKIQRNLAAMIAGGLGAQVDPVRGTRPSNEEVAERAWALAKEIMDREPGYKVWMPESCE